MTALQSLMGSPKGLQLRVLSVPAKALYRYGPWLRDLGFGFGGTGAEGDVGCRGQIALGVKEKVEGSQRLWGL